ncbi:MAG: ABC transporter ATP-binding protein [Cryobacterium sp.]|nr:ABC transporter ATP-binding protein [Cryobacterium sp.]MBX3090261.1 ABC transporter ATP-binding protein [Cryobacterium sp.]MCO5293607.1 ABC transporter ATP-binding protein [Homoserinimonas sp.]MCW5944696.1 ABC transporter ATP-binding protein [Cryobacterium sp.]
MGFSLDTVDHVQNADSILAKFDALIEKLHDESAEEKRTVQAEVKKKQKKAKAEAAEKAVVLRVEGLSKQFGETKAVDEISLEVSTGTVQGIVGPNGAGKTTTLSMICGLLRPDEGKVFVDGMDVWANPAAAKRQMGVLPDRLRLFDRLTGNQLLYYAGILRDLPPQTVRERIVQLSRTFGFEDALPRLVADYSAGMVKKIALAAALIHSPKLLVLDEPFESVDPVSASAIIEVLGNYVKAGGTVVLSSHSMELIERMCDSVAIIVDGKVLVSGTVDEVRGAGRLEDKFIEVVGGKGAVEDLEWLHDFSS